MVQSNSIGTNIIVAPKVAGLLLDGGELGPVLKGRTLTGRTGRLLSAVEVGDLRYIAPCQSLLLQHTSQDHCSYFL